MLDHGLKDSLMMKAGHDVIGPAAIAFFADLKVHGVDAIGVTTFDSAVFRITIPTRFHRSVSEKFAKDHGVTFPERISVRC